MLPVARLEKPAIAGARRLSLEGVGMAFHRDREWVQVLAGVDLGIYEREFVCIVGPSGCGKSTLLNLIGGFIRPTSGKVRIDGEEVRGPDPRRIFVFQERGVFPWLTVEENIGFGLFRMPRREKALRIEHYVGLVGLHGFERSYPHELSGGMKQRVEVARALAVDPDMLFLDEPFGALDSITRLIMRKELLRIWKVEQKTILFVTHDIDEAVQLADRVVVLSARPAWVRRIVQIDIPRPRDMSSRSYLNRRDEIFEEIGLAHQV